MHGFFDCYILCVAILNKENQKNQLKSKGVKFIIHFSVRDIAISSCADISLMFPPLILLHIFT